MPVATPFPGPLCLRLLLVILLMGVGFPLTAQNLRTIDSLRSRLSRAPAPDQFEILNAIGFEYRYSSPDSTIYYCSRAFELGNKLMMKKRLARPLSFIGLAKSYEGNFNEALRYHNQAIEMAVAQQDTVQMAHGYNNLGRLFFDQGDLVRAYNNFMKAKELFDYLHDKSGLAYVYRSLASLFKSKQDNIRALENSKKALALRKELGESRAVASAYMELGLVYEDMDSTRLALLQFRLADSIATAVNDRITKAELSVGMAEIYFAEHQIREAAMMAENVLRQVTENANLKVYLRARLIQVRCKMMKGETSDVISILKQILKSSERSGNHIFQRDAALYLSQAYAAANKASEAREFNDLYQILEAKIRNADLNKEIERLQFQLQIEKAEKENASLRTRQAQDEILISSQRFQNIVLILVVFFMAIFAVVFFAVSARRKKMNIRLEEQNQHIISQREEIERKNEFLSKTNADLDALNHEKDALMNIVAHDLKSPLHRIYGLTHILQLEGPLTKTQEEYVRLINESTRGGLDLISGLLDVHALEEMNEMPAPLEFNVDELLREKVNSFLPMAEQKRIKIDLDCPVMPPVVMIRDYVSRIVDNLLSNAVKFSVLGGMVTVAARMDDGKLVLTFKDAGPGFSPADQKLIFQKFKRLSARPTGGESSNGLGLAIVKALVDRLKGEIQLDTTSKGSCFTVRLPLVQA